MRDILPQLHHWHEEGRTIALATVVQTWGSAPRRAGARMAITGDGEVAGSVSGGCVENAAVEAALEVLRTGQARLLHFNVADEAAWEVGLACGGGIDIFVRPLDADFFEIAGAAWMNEGPAVAATLIEGPQELLGKEALVREGVVHRGTIPRELEPAMLALAARAASQGSPQRVRLNESVEVFLEPIVPPPTLIAVGGVHIAMALVTLAKALGYRTVIIDPRKTWGSAERFPDVDQLIQAWPEAAFRLAPLMDSCAVVMLTHDPKLDDPALKIALASPAFYVGALGSKSTQTARRERLLGSGVTEAQLARLHAPIGLDIGAQSPEEIALAILAEVVEAYRKRPSNQEDVHEYARASVERRNPG